MKSGIVKILAFGLIFGAIVGSAIPAISAQMKDEGTLSHSFVATHAGRDAIANVDLNTGGTYIQLYQTIEQGTSTSEKQT